jgi:PKD repeat protein
MKKHLLVLAILLFTKAGLTQTQLIGFEYWFDNDYAAKQVTTVSPVSQLQVNQAVLTNTLSNGIHTLNFRAWDNQGRYTVTLSQFFYKTPESANVNRDLIAYEYWFDNDYANATSVNTPVQQQVNINELITTGALSNGIHTFNIRFKDNTQQWSSTLSQFFYKTPESAVTNRDLVAYEYWFDNDYANATSVNTPVQQQVNINELITTGALSNGIHTFNIRFKDNTQQWSSTLSQFFYKTPESAATNRDLVAYEYWFDNDYANATSVNTPVQQQVNINELITTGALSNGIHTFNIRFKDNTQQWSSTLSQFFYKTPESAATNRDLVAYEYWFDNDYANATAINTPVQQQVNINELITTGALSNGIHTFNIRFKDNTQQWSSTLSQFFYKSITHDLDDNKIVAYRYWFDDAFEEHTFITLPTPVEQVNITDPLNLTQISKGEYTLHFQFKDVAGMWSVVTTDTIYKNSLPIAQFSANETQFCEDGTVYFDNTSIDGNTYVWDFGDGTFSNDTAAVHTYQQPGVYSVSLTATDTDLNIDSTFTVVQYIYVYSTPNASIQIIENDTICEGDEVTLLVESGYNYMWSTGEETASITTSNAGEYSVLVVHPDFAQCQSQSEELVITVIQYPIANFEIIESGLAIQFTNTSPIADSYQWNFGDGSTSQQVSPTHSYTTAASYETYLVAYNYCGNDTAYLTIDLTYLSDGKVVQTQKIKIYPNPTSEFFAIDLGKEAENGTRIQLLDGNGKLVKEQQLLTTVGQQHTIDITNLPAGLYHVVIMHNEQLQSIEKLVVMP